jgi:isopenicillin N synthase-like dioxygenase
MDKDESSSSSSSSYLWPVVDCSKLIRGEVDPIADAAIAHALTTRGFFFAQHVLEDVVTSPASEDETTNTTITLQEVYEASRTAHGLPVEMKQQYAGAGYSGSDVQGAPELAYEATKTATVRAWDYAAESNSFVNDQSRYPAGLETIMTRLYHRQAMIGKILLRAMARGLSRQLQQEQKGSTTTTTTATTLPEDAFSRFTQNGELGSLRLLHYPAVSQEECERVDLIGVSAHTDFEAFTLMHQDAPGLQVRARHSKVWESVPMEVVDDESNANTLLCIVGDVLERLTNGYLQATPHRVLPQTYDRYAIIRFNALAADATIAPLPAFCNDTHPEGTYSPTTMKEIMQTVMDNLNAGKGAWDPVLDKSTTADYDYRQRANNRPENQDGTTTATTTAACDASSSVTE